MNVSFKTIRRSGDKVYILSEISGYDERLPVVLVASTESGARIPSDTFPYCDAMAFKLVARTSSDLRHEVITLPEESMARNSNSHLRMESQGSAITKKRTPAEFLV